MMKILIGLAYAVASGVSSATQEPSCAGRLVSVHVNFEPDGNPFVFSTTRKLLAGGAIYAYENEIGERILDFHRPAFKVKSIKLTTHGLYMSGKNSIGASFTGIHVNGDLANPITVLPSWYNVVQVKVPGYSEGTIQEIDFDMCLGGTATGYAVRWNC